MSKRIVFTLPNGTLAVVHPAPKGRRSGESEEDWLARVSEKTVPHLGGVNVRIVDCSELPQDRTFRDAWTADGVCMNRAREIHRQRLREMRKPHLQQLDVDYQRADEDGGADRKKLIAKKKQELRDITKHPDIDAAQTPEELAKVGL